MKNFEIQCIVYDKNNPSNLSDDITEISLHTVILADTHESAILVLSNSYNIKEIILIQEIL